MGYLGTNNAKEVEERAAAGDEKARLIQEALFYQVSKMIGEMAVVLEGKIDAILITGGLAFSPNAEKSIRQKAGFLAPIYTYPGEDELKALAMNALLVANGEVEVKEYER